MDEVLSQTPRLSKPLVFCFELIPCDFVYISIHWALPHHSHQLLPNVCTCSEFIPWLFCLYRISSSSFVLSQTFVHRRCVFWPFVSCVLCFVDCSSMFWLMPVLMIMDFSMLLLFACSMRSTWYYDNDCGFPQINHMPILYTWSISSSRKNFGTRGWGPHKGLYTKFIHKGENMTSSHEEFKAKSIKLS